MTAEGLLWGCTAYATVPSDWSVGMRITGPGGGAATETEFVWSVWGWNLFKFDKEDSWITFTAGDSTLTSSSPRRGTTELPGREPSGWSRDVMSMGDTLEFDRSCSILSNISGSSTLTCWTSWGLVETSCKACCNRSWLIVWSSGLLDLSTLELSLGRIKPAESDSMNVLVDSSILSHFDSCMINNNSDSKHCCKSCHHFPSMLEKHLHHYFHTLSQLSAQPPSSQSVAANQPNSTIFCYCFVLKASSAVFKHLSRRLKFHSNKLRW